MLYRSVNFGAEARQTRETKYTKKRLGDTRSRSAMALSSPPAPERAAVVMARSSSYPRSCVHPPPSSCATSASMPPSFCASAIVMDGSDCTHSPERRLKATAGVAGSRTTSSVQERESDSVDAASQRSAAAPLAGADPPLPEFFDPRGGGPFESSVQPAQLTFSETGKIRDRTRGFEPFVDF